MPPLSLYMHWSLRWCRSTNFLMVKAFGCRPVEPYMLLSAAHAEESLVS